jgi:hypothetical protein
MRVVGILDINPVVGFEFAEFGISVAVITYILRNQQRTAD